jgi:methyl-accepting chemotaxis protein
MYIKFRKFVHAWYNASTNSGDSSMKLHVINSTKRKLFAASAAIVLIPLTIVGLIVNFEVTSIAEKTYIQGMTGEISQIDGMITTMFEGTSSSISIIGNFATLRKQDPSINRYNDKETETINKDVKRSPSEQIIHSHLNLVLESNRDYDGAIYASAYGAYVVADPGAKIPPKFDPKTRPYFNLAMSKPGEMILSKVYKGLRGNNVVVAARAFKDDDGNYSYLGGAAVNLNSLSDKIGAMKIGQTGYVALMDTDGTIVAHPVRKELVGKNVTEVGVPELTEAVKNGTGTIHYTFGGQTKIATVLTGKKTGWRLIGIVSEDEVLAGARKLRIIILLIGVLFAAGAVCGGYLLAKKIADPIESVVAALNETAKGNFTQSIDAAYETRHDEIGLLARTFNAFIQKMRGTISELQTTFDQVAVSADQIAHTIASFSANIQTESANSEEITASTEEISAGMENVATNAQIQNETMLKLISQISGLAESINAVSILIKKTGDLSSDMSADAKAGESALLSMEESMKKIIESSNDMTSILKIISDISDQINLLSLNAAIEAARAGDAGRGFAVVADEISQLADQTAASVKDIGNLISINNSEIRNGQAGVTGSIGLISKMIKQVEYIKNIAAEMQGIMVTQLKAKETVAADADKIKALSDQIAFATGENKIGIIEITKSVTDISQLSQNNAAGTEQMASSAEELAGMAESVKTRMNEFQI